ncbi:nucleoside diphosphate kinase regulator [Mesorhizobium sp. BAC0120]|uniref:nucleoside diphosphate kinase regulator n=1 Tax=Mesorhizobium sp. BAC0120 TaxID=3090670 RepID=UPI00298D20EA|nr:nucleoside diphosphate kinase regulator [Mesorhizobium sp. BAC0120]MDW6022247.1 nucleoside diphosphate kinase regulator [Mesorhizobium sp. BAC0120]
MTTKIRRKPQITIAKTESARLLALAAALAERNPELSDTMFGELERARVVTDDAVAGNVVRMGSVVTYQPDGDEPRTVTLVYPGNADIDQARISVATPVGVALIGLSPGQSMAWTARDGRSHELTVLAVHSPEAVLP